VQGVTRNTALLLGALLVVGAAVDAGAQPASLHNANVETRAASGALAPVVDAIAARAATAEWVAYAVSATESRGRSCCGGGDGCCGGCRLEPGRGEMTDVSGPSARARLEPSATLHLFIRVEQGRVDRLRMFSDDCAIDAGGATVHWLTGVDGAASVRWLGDVAAGAGERRVANGALAALVMHADGTAVDRLIAIARTGATTHARGQALFWLGQRATAAAIGAIAQAIDEDPETGVKRRAVFALSQLPADEGVPRLIDVARTHSNAAVRRQAMFWLSQSKDPRALRFFEEILKP
jgi:hypothetical protein